MPLSVLRRSLGQSGFPGMVFVMESTAICIVALASKMYGNLQVKQSITLKE
ncbi:MAG: hypothetical protein OXC46_00435 [Thaumarchaeota archaeon]|nr:hypothetical protein [Nitrososphaerota archaeon]